MTSGLLGLDRIRLGTFPTPLQPAPRLSRAVGIEIWLKRDDLSGFGLGGNKVRGLEYLLADASSCDCVVTGGGSQSNWAMLAALAARVQGLDAHLVCYGQPVPLAGNLLLAQGIGAQVHFTGDDDRASVDRVVEELAAELRAGGRRPYPLPRGGATPLGAIGYVRASLELAQQLIDLRLRPGQLWLATGSCGTQAGLVAGARWLRLGYEVVGVAVSRTAIECRERVSELAAQASVLLGNDPGPANPRDVRVLSGPQGTGYGIRSAEGDDAADLVARTEGVFCDPVFAAKAMSGLLAAARSGQARGPIVFLVSGGAPTLFTV